MPFYSGRTADGSDAKEVHGAFINPENENQWASTPYKKQRQYMEVMKYMSSFDDVRKQILNKKCPLSVSLRKYVLSLYDEKGNFKAPNY